MTETTSQAEKKKKIVSGPRLVLVFGYLSVFLFYGMAGAVLSSLLFPDFPFFVFFVVSAFVGGKIDYKLKGPASKFERKYASQMEK